MWPVFFCFVIPFSSHRLGGDKFLLRHYESTTKEHLPLCVCACWRKKSASMFIRAGSHTSWTAMCIRFCEYTKANLAHISPFSLSIYIPEHVCHLCMWCLCRRVVFPVTGISMTFWYTNICFVAQPAFLWMNVLWSIKCFCWKIRLFTWSTWSLSTMNYICSNINWNKHNH